MHLHAVMSTYVQFLLFIKTEWLIYILVTLRFYTLGLHVPLSILGNAKQIKQNEI